MVGLCVCVARPERFELPTTWFVARYSIQLSYGRFGEREFSGFRPALSTRRRLHGALPIRATRRMIARHPGPSRRLADEAWSLT